MAALLQAQQASGPNPSEAPSFAPNAPDGSTSALPAASQAIAQELSTATTRVWGFIIPEELAAPQTTQAQAENASNNGNALAPTTPGQEPAKRGLLSALLEQQAATGQSGASSSVVQPIAYSDSESESESDSDALSDGGASSEESDDCPQQPKSKPIDIPLPRFKNKAEKIECLKARASAANERRRKNECLLLEIA